MDAMLMKVASCLLLLSFIASLSGVDGATECNCDDDEAFWSIDSMLFVQRTSDLFIALAYFSIPLEIIYFVSRSNFPFKWVLIEFGAFIIFCGLTHFLSFMTYLGQRTFHILVAILVSKLLTALISVLTAVSLVNLIPMLLKVKLRELMLIQKNWDLDQQVGKIKQKEEVGKHVRMLTQEIRKSLDRHTILYTTLVELSKILNLQNCVIWMPDENRTEMRLTHDPTRADVSSVYNNMPIPISDPDVKEIKASNAVKILDVGSKLAAASSRKSCDPETVAAIRIPMLKVSNFRTGTPEIVPRCYAILVLVLPCGSGRFWSNQEIEIVKAAADQVVVALSHAAMIEESQNISERLLEQNRALQKAKQDALRASDAKSAFQTVMSNRLRRPIHSIMCLISVLQEEKLTDEQKLLVGSMIKTSHAVSTLMDDVIDNSTKADVRFPLEMRHFKLHSLIREAACLVKCLCAAKGYNITIEVDKSLPNHVMGDERRFFQVFLHIVGNLLNGTNGGHLTFRVLPASEDYVTWKTRRSNSSSDRVYTRFEICTSVSQSQSEIELCTPTSCSGDVEEGLRFSVCRKLVHLMQGDIIVEPNPEGFDQSMVVIVGFQRQPSIPVGMSGYGESSDPTYPHPLLHGVKVLLVDYDDMNRAVTRKMLEKLGCIVSVVSSGYECLGAVCSTASLFQIVVLDLHPPLVDGFEVTRRLRKRGMQDWPLIIGLVETTDEDVGQKCLQIGMNGIIPKPVLLPGLADELQKVLLQARRVMP
ncbi:dehydration-induced protein ERD15 [Capsicum annuum]|uniref:ethylene receptor 2-like n=1 Tax=Capsicum annuum TaxID=4072 RepID=UPI001FB0FA86|nr:ethylene receptor 2-like [Capsicum annuum]XP_016566512.2 ethylene receptor 2-like [Capsicum annuum]KAF3647853.1 dehydration-induced protein ERD15 [Capsicum annuum]KAF3650755.1 dehydration-induced protein ERD15 [Capsicum annuum]